LGPTYGVRRLLIPLANVLSVFLVYRSSIAECHKHGEIAMVYLNSSAIRRVEYNPVTRRMVIEFTSGHSYPFCGVPENVYKALIAASSAGQYYHDHIKGHYEC